MFISKSSHGYYRGTEQHSGRGRYLALFSWNSFKADGPAPARLAYDNGKPMLWATVRSCSLAQLGHFMMGTIVIGGKSITVSGPIGHDGLPLDYQDVPVAYRHLLVEVPADVAAVYWADNGHNDVGSARPILRDWARTQFGA
jgi:hypothetical protein